MHEQRAQSALYSDGESHQFWQGSSLFGIESVHARELRDIGYTWIYVSFPDDEQQLHIKRWPRRAMLTESGSWRMGDDPALVCHPHSMSLKRCDGRWQLCLPATSVGTPPLRQSPPRTQPSNPFSSAGQITQRKDFIGRERLLQQLLHHIRIGSNVSLLGPARSGRSSILRMLCARAGEAGISAGHAVFLDMQLLSTTDAFIDALSHELRIPPSRGYALWRALRGRRCLLCIDEVEQLSNDALGSEVRQALRGLADGSDAPLTLVLASRSPLDELLPYRHGDTSPLYNFCTTVEVAPFTLAECEALAKLDETEKHALWAYLRTIPPLPYGQR